MAIDMDIEMETITDSVPYLLDFSGYSTTTHTSDDDCNWNHWSPLINWDSFTIDNGDFHNLIDSITDAAAGGSDILSPDQGSVDEDSSISAITATMEDEGGGGDNNLKGLRLVHLLMAAAEAVTGGNKSRDLARVILIRLKQLVSPTHGTTMERLAAHFTDALQTLLEGASGCAHNTSTASKHQQQCVIGGDHYLTDMLAAFQLLQDMSPYVKFGHFTANQAILEAVAHEKRVHIVDYDVMEGTQWASLMQAFSSTGPPGPHLRITALSRGPSGRRSFATVQETGRRLTAFAATLCQPFSFHHCRLDHDETFRPSSLKLVRGEVLVFNCMMHLPHLSYRSSDSVVTFLSGAKELNARLVTLVEEEIGPIGDAGFVGRFMDSLQYYSAMYDSLEGGFPMQSRARALVERVFLGPRIAASLGRMYWRDGEEERGSWGEWLSATGFTGVPVSFANHSQAKMLVGLFNDGYRVEELGNNKLMLGWKSRRLLSASIWTSFSVSDSDV